MLYGILKRLRIYDMQSLFESLRRYGLKNARFVYEDGKSFEEIKNRFNDEKSLKMSSLIEQKAGTKFEIKTMEDLGYCVFGSVIFDFVHWLGNVSKDYERLWFLSREGYLLKRAFDIYCPNSKSVYFLASRRACSFAAIRNKDDIKEIMSQYYSGEMDKLLYSRLGIETDDKSHIEMPSEIERAMQHIDAENIIKKAAEERFCYRNYIESVSEGNAAAVDIGYNATIQYYLNKIAQKNFDGFYICLHFHNKLRKSSSKCKALYPVYNFNEEKTNKIFKNQLFFEAVLKAPFGQLIRMERNGIPIYTDDGVMNDDIKRIQNGICNFIKDMGKENYGLRLNTFSIDLLDFALNKANINNNLFRSFNVEDNYCSGGILKLSDGKWKKESDTSLSKISKNSPAP